MFKTMCVSPIILRQYETFFNDRLSCFRNCFCCSMAIAAGFLAVYLLITYLIAFAFELLWILESSAGLPTAAVLLCAGYFALALFAALLIHGLATKNTLCLIAWMFAVTVLTFPEAGMVIYMSIQFWRIESLYGITELTCWLARILANVIEIVLVQSLYTVWKEEEIVSKRLRDLSLQAVTIPADTAAYHQNGAQFYQNNAFNTSMEQLQYLGSLKRASSTPHLFTFPNNMMGNVIDYYQGYQGYQGYQLTTASEFNASIFAPQKIDNQPTESLKKTQSLMDLRQVATLQIPPPPTTQENKLSSKESLPNGFWPINYPRANYTLSLGRQAHTKLPKFASLDELNQNTTAANEEGRDPHLIRNRTGFYAQPVENYGVPIYYGPLDGPDFLIYKKQVDKLSSKNSLSNASAEDVQKYRDVAL